MKKIFYLAALLSLGTVAQAQQNVVFKIKYLPNHKYDGGMNMGIAAKVNLSGNDSVINKLKSQGLTLPLALNMNMKMDANMQTLSSDAKGTFPMSVDYKLSDLSLDMNGNAIPIPTEKLGTAVRLYAHISSDGILHADSISGAKTSDTSNEKMAKMMDAVQKNIKFPDHAMQIGESYTQDMPMSLPIAGSNLDVKSKIVYKLVSIADGNANFDVVQTMNMTIPVKGSTITMTGDGTGKIVYSIKDHFATDYMSNINLKVTGTVQGISIDATAQLNMDYKYTIN